MSDSNLGNQAEGTETPASEIEPANQVQESSRKLADAQVVQSVVAGEQRGDQVTHEGSDPGHNQQDQPARAGKTT